MADKPDPNIKKIPEPTGYPPKEGPQPLDPNHKKEKFYIQLINPLPTLMKYVTNASERHEIFKYDLVPFEDMMKTFAAYVRGEVEDFIKGHEELAKSKEEPLDHIFEVQYFAILFALAVATSRFDNSDPTFFPTTNDLAYIVHNFVNAVPNVKIVSKDFHDEKTRHLRAGTVQKNISPKVLKYLEDHAKTFKTYVDKLEVDMRAPHKASFDFRKVFFKCVKETPWYTGNWKAYLTQGQRFATNLTNEDALTKTTGDD